MAKVNLIIRNGRYMYSDDNFDYYVCNNHAYRIKAGSPEALIMYKLNSIPRNLDIVVKTVEDARRHNSKLDSYLGDRTVKQIISDLEESNLITRTESDSIAHAQRVLMEKLNFEPSILSDTCDMKITEKIYAATQEDNLRYPLGLRSLDENERKVFCAIKRSCEPEEITKEVINGLDRKSVSLKGILSAVKNIEKKDVYRIVYELLNKNMLVVSPA